jgi:hypothetical protein
MSSISVAAEECAASGQPQPVVDSFPGRDTKLGQLNILRALPMITLLPRLSLPGIQVELSFPSGQVAFFASQSI